MAQVEPNIYQEAIELQSLYDQYHSMKMGDIIARTEQMNDLITRLSSLSSELLTKLKNSEGDEIDLHDLSDMFILLQNMLDEMKEDFPELHFDFPQDDLTKVTSEDVERIKNKADSLLSHAKGKLPQITNEMQLAMQLLALIADINSNLSDDQRKYLERIQSRMTRG